MKGEASTPTTVYKLGGSLLDWPGFPLRLGELLRRDAATSTAAVVAGGGAAADAVRRWDKAHGLSAEKAHQLAIAAMDQNACLVRAALVDLGFSITTQVELVRPGLVLVPDMEVELHRAGSERRPDETGDDVPPATWDVTSDSLAAWLARRLGARHLILLKSTHAPADRTVAAAVAEGLVDPYLPRGVEGLQVGWLNLRGESLTPVPLRI